MKRILTVVFTAVMALVLGVTTASAASHWYRPPPKPKATTTTTTAPVSGPQPYMLASFFQPGSGGGNNLTWSQARYNTEVQQMKDVKTTDIIIQWTINDRTSYYPSGNSWYTMAQDMVGRTIEAQRATGSQGKVWLGLALPLYWDWYVNAGDPTWIQNLLAQQKAIATELAQKYPGKLAGLYIPQEVDDALLVDAAKTNGARTYYTGLVAHIHSLGLKAMTSPFYAGKRLTPAAWGPAVKSLFGATGIDVLNMQDGGGDPNVSDAEIVQYFSATKNSLAGTGVSLWVDHDMYQGSSPAPPADLQSRLKALAPYVSVATGFQFMAHMGPTDLGTSTYYDAYKTYVFS